jgi:hypothetical protein
VRILEGYNSLTGEPKALKQGRVSMTTETILTYLGLVLGIIGLIASYYFYKLSIRKKEPVYSIRSNNIISGSKSKYENLRVLYINKEVENFTVSKILFFNRGSETITRKDIETSYPLRVSTKDCQLLDAFVLQINKPSNNFTLTWDKSGDFVYIDFDYLDKNQGGVVQIAHTGLSSDNIKVEGDIMGVQALPEVFSIETIDFDGPSPSWPRIISVVILYNRGKISRVPKGLEKFLE